MTDYNVIVEVDVTPTPKRATAWLDALASYSPAVSRTSRNRTELVITVPAKTLEQATTTGLAVLLHAVGQLHPDTLQVMSSDEYDRRADDIAIPHLVGATEAAEIIGISRQRIQQLAADGSLPSMTVGKALVFPRSAVDTLVEQRAGSARIRSRALPVAIPRGKI